MSDDSFRKVSARSPRKNGAATNPAATDQTTSKFHFIQLREASLLAAKFFKELAEVLQDEDGNGKSFCDDLGCWRRALIFAAGEDTSQQKWLGGNFPKENLLTAAEKN